MGKKRKRARNKKENSENIVETAVKKTEDGKQKYTTEDILERVEQYVESFEFELALKFCQKALDLEPENTTVLETFGNTCAEVNDIENARKYFFKAVSLEPDKGHIKYLYLGQLSEGREAVNYYTCAIKIMKELAESQKNNAANNEVIILTNKDISNVYCSLAEIFMTDSCMEDDAEEKCEKYCKEAIEIDDENPDAYVAMCNFFLSRDDIESAKNAAEKAFVLWKRITDVAEDSLLEMISYETRVTLIKILIEVECYDKVSAIVDQLIEENEDDIRIWYYLGLTKSLIKGSDNPRFYLEKALQLFEKTGYEDDDMKSHVLELLEVCPVEDEESMVTIKEEDEIDSDNDEKEMETEE